MTTPQCVPGDIVRYDDRALVVVDVTGDGFAVLREPDDLTLQNPIATRVGDLTPVGHVDSLAGWIEGSHGEWRKVDDDNDHG